MSTLVVRTWNLCGLDERSLDERTEAACVATLLYDAPDVVMLQEVVRRSLFAHLRPHFAAAGFTLAPAEPISDSEYFCAIAVRQGLVPKAAWRRPFPGSQMGRALLGLEVEWDGRPLLLTTSHLESLKSGAKERHSQVRQVVDALGQFEGLAVFGGDTNLRLDLDEVLAGGGVRDAWRLAGAPRRAEATWWPLDAKGPRGKPLRFDRIWVSGAWQVQECSAGEDRRVGAMRISDHLFVQATLAV